MLRGFKKFTIYGSVIVAGEAFRALDAVPEPGPGFAGRDESQNGDVFVDRGALDAPTAAALAAAVVGVEAGGTAPCQRYLPLILCLFICPIYLPYLWANK